MPKRVFWPLTLVVMGLIFIAANMGMLPAKFWDLWPIILIVVGLGGLVTSDKEEWDTVKEKPKSKKPHPKGDRSLSGKTRKTVKKSSSRKSKSKKK